MNILKKCTLLISFIFALLITSCNEKTTTPSEEKLGNTLFTQMSSDSLNIETSITAVV